MKTKTRCITEGGLMIAAALVLSYFKIQFLQAGSINFCMVPLIICEVRWGLGWGVVAGAIFGTLKYFLAGGFALNIASFFLERVILRAADAVRADHHPRAFRQRRFKFHAESPAPIASV